MSAGVVTLPAPEPAGQIELWGVYWYLSPEHRGWVAIPPPHEANDCPRFPVVSVVDFSERDAIASEDAAPLVTGEVMAMRLAVKWSGAFAGTYVARRMPRWMQTMLVGEGTRCSAELADGRRCQLDAGHEAHDYPECRKGTS